MATQTQQLSTTQTAQVLAQLQSQALKTAAYMETYLGNIDMLDPVFTTLNNTTMAGHLSNGDQFTFTGSNLLGYPATLHNFHYASAAGVTFNANGALTVLNSDGSGTGSFTTLSVQDNSNGQSIDYTYTGSFTADSMQVSSLLVAQGNTSMQLTGDMQLNDNDQLLGTVTGITLTENGQVSSLTDISLDASQVETQSYQTLLSQALTGNDLITGGANDDILQGYAGDDIINGAEGTDTAVFNINQADVISARPLKSGGIAISSSEGQDTLINVELLDFLDNDISVTTFLQSLPVPTVSLSKGGASQSIIPEIYTGPVTYLQYQMLGGSEGEVFTGTDGNDFINLLGGDDAANGGAGDDVLDGGIGSNFLVGGGGDDTFFLDGRSGVTTWSTITDFSDDEVNIWGWQEGISQLLATESNAGAAGYEGVTYHYDLNNDGTIDTSITFTGLTENDIQTSTHSIEGNGYLLMV